MFIHRAFSVGFYQNFTIIQTKSRTSYEEAVCPDTVKLIKLLERRSKPFIQHCYQCLQQHKKSTVWIYRAMILQ